jgi:hypothetical protein
LIVRERLADAWLAAAVYALLAGAAVFSALPIFV